MLLPPALSEALQVYARAVREVETLAGSAVDARPAFVADARTLRTRADGGDPLARAELARREARHALHRAAELAAVSVDWGLQVADQGSADPPAAAPVPEPPEPRPVSRGAAALRSWREGRKLSQSAAAELLGVPRSTWATWEAGTAAPGRAHWPTLETVTKIPRSTWGG